MAPSWTVENVAHLLRRTGFFFTQKDLDKALQKGLSKTLEDIFKPGKWKGKVAKKHGLSGMQGDWLAAMVKSKNQLHDRLTLFWHDHFATALHKVGKRDYMFNHVGTLHEHAYGPFADMLLAISRDPAMLVWLDNKTSVVGNPNENFARELMEVFSTGVLDKDGNPNYTETDVEEIARCFTGWTIKDDEFFFKASHHDEGIKTVKGVTGNLDGTDVIDILYMDPATSRRIPQKLFSFFGYPVELDHPVCDDLQGVYENSNGDIRTVLEAVFLHDEFYSPEAKGALVKGPIEFLVGSLKMIGAKVNKKYAYKMGDWIGDLGQSLYNPPSVFGWDEGLPWVSTSGMLARAEVAHRVADARDKKDPLKYKPDKLMGKKGDWDEMDAAAVVDRVLGLMGVEAPAASTRTALEDYVRADNLGLPQTVTVDSDFIDKKVRGLIALIMSSPEFQLN